MKIGLGKNHLLFTVVFSALTLYATNASAQTLTLYEAIQQALAHNKTILYNTEQRFQSARAQLIAAEAVYRKTLNTDLRFLHDVSQNEPVLSNEETSSPATLIRSQVFPGLRVQQIFLTPFGSRLTASAGVATTIDGFSSPTFHNNTQLSLSLSQPLSAAGIVSGHADRIQARKNFKLAGYDFTLQREQLALAVIESYYQVWQVNRSLEQSLRDSTSSFRLWELAKLKLKSGMIAESEVLNLEVQYRLAVDALAQTRNTLQTQTIVFKRLLGDKTTSPLTLSPEIPRDSLGMGLEQIIDKAQRNRLEIKQAQIGLALAKLSLAQTASLFSPTLRFDLLYNLNSLPENSVLNAFTRLPNYGLNVQATLSLPINDGGRNTAQQEIAKRSLAIQSKNLELLKEDMAIDIESRYRTLKLNQRRVMSLALSLVIAEEALHISELKFKSGQISSTEIENVRDRYNAALNALNSVKISSVIERAGLARATGEFFEWIERIQ